MNAEEKPLTEMTDEEILAQIRMLRERRAEKRDARAAERSAPKGVKKDPKEASASEAAIMRALLKDLP